MKSLYRFNKLLCMDGMFGERYYIKELVYCDNEFIDGYAFPGSMCLISKKLMYCVSRLKGCGYFIERKCKKNALIL